MPTAYQFEFEPVILPPEKQAEWFLQHEFEFVNRQAVPVNLEVVGTSCGCAQCDLSESMLGPGESCLVSMKVYLTYERRRRIETAFVSCEPTLGKHLSFSIGAEVFPAIKTSPWTKGLIFDLSALPTWENLQVTRYGPLSSKNPELPAGKLQIIGPPQLDVEVAPEVRETVGNLERSNFLVKIGLSKNAQHVVGDALEIGFRWGGDTFAMPISVRDSGGVSVTPSQLYLAGNRSSAKVELKGKVAFEVADAVTSDDRFQIRRLTNEALDIRHEFEVQLADDAGTTKSSPKTFVEFTIQGADTSVLRVPVLIFGS